MRRPRNPVEKSLIENPTMRTRIERPKRGGKSYDRKNQKDSTENE